MKLSRKAAAAVLAAALTLSLCVISALPGGQPRMDAMTYNIDTLPARDLRPVVDGPETEADYTPPAQAIHTAAQEEAAAEVSAEAPAPEAPAREKTESAAPAQPVSSTSVLAVGVVADSVRLRAAANTGSAILAELNRGTAVSILGRQDGWYKVNYDGKTGYMSADYVTARSSAGDLRCVARVISDGLNLRSGAAASGAVLATASRGEYVDVSGFENGWFHVSYNGSTGYVSADYLNVDQDNVFTTYGRVNSDGVNVRSDASTDSSVLATIEEDAIVTVNGLVDGWYDVTCEYGTEGYIRSDFLDLTESSSSNSDIAATAKQYLGTGYVYGGASPRGFDCSGFTMYVYSQHGYSLPHSATSQWQSGLGTRVYSISELQPGDLVFFNDPSRNAGKACSHAGIYTGDGQFIHSSSSRSGGVIVSSLTSGYYNTYFVGGIQV